MPLTLIAGAAADRRGDQRVSALAAEIAGSNENAIVISDGVRDPAKAMSFQAMKGLNDFAETDVYIILTHLAAEKYAELNILGQWLGIGEDVIRLHYEDQINQAVGPTVAFVSQRSRPRRLWSVP